MSAAYKRLLTTQVTQLVLHSLPEAPPAKPDIPRSLDLLKVRHIPLAFYR